MDQLIDLRRCVMEYITRFKERRINDLLSEAIKDLEDANEARRKSAMDEENKRRVLEGIFVDLVRKIRQRRCPQMAQKIMIMLLEKHSKRQKMQEELLDKFKVRDNTLLKDTIKKLEEANEVRRKEAWIVKLNMDQLIDLRRGVMEYITRFKERRINALFAEAIKDLEDANEARRKRAMDEENKRRVLEGIFVDLVRKIRQRRCPQMAQKIMSMLIDKHNKRQEIQKELLAKFNVRDNKMLKDTIKKLEGANDFRRKKAWDQENRRRVLDNIFVDLVRKMRERRCPQMAKKIMIKLLELHDKRGELHEQLIAKTKEREQRMLAMEQIHRELLERVQQRENIKHRANVLKEMMDKITELKLVQIKKSGYVDNMHSQIEKPEEDDDFLPRKLFFFGVDTLDIQPKITLEAAMKQSSSNEMAEERKELKLESDTGQQCHLPKKPKMRTTFLGRLRRLFGLK